MQLHSIINILSR